MSYSPNNPNGQATKANSAPVTLASDQGTLAVSDSAAETSLSSIVTNTGNAATSANQTNGNQQIQGNVASGSTDSGNPVKTGGVFNTTQPTLTTGQRGDMQLGSRGSLRVELFGASSTTGASSVLSGADGVSNSTTGINMYTFPRVFNGTTWDRQYGDAISGAWVNVKGGLSPNGTALNTYSIHLTTNTTTTPTASNAYISSIAISSEVAGTTSTVTIQDKQGTPLKLINGLSTTVLTTTPTIANFQTPVKMVSGIDIITSGSVAATIDVWINYYQ